MKIAALTVAVFALWAALIGITGWLLPRKHKQWERMEDMMNDGCQTSITLVILGCISIVIVFAGAMMFGFI